MSVKFLIFLIFLHSFLVYLEKTYSVFVKALRRVVEDALQRPLDNTARSQDALAQLHKSLPDLQRRRTACVNNGTLSGTSSYWTSSECLCCGEKKKKKRQRTSDPNISFLSWMRIHPILQPGTSQRLAKPPQERMGTLLLREAMDGQS